MSAFLFSLSASGVSKVGEAALVVIARPATAFYTGLLRKKPIPAVATAVLPQPDTKPAVIAV